MGQAELLIVGILVAVAGLSALARRMSAGPRGVSARDLKSGALGAGTPRFEQEALDARSLQGGSDLLRRDPALRPVSCQYDTGGERTQQPPQGLHRLPPSISKRRVPSSSAAISASTWDHQTKKAWFIGPAAYARRGPTAVSRRQAPRSVLGPQYSAPDIGCATPEASRVHARSRMRQRQTGTPANARVFWRPDLFRRRGDRRPRADAVW
jgi:hypothetical protein